MEILITRYYFALEFWRTLCHTFPQNWWVSRRSIRRSQKEFHTEFLVLQEDFLGQSHRHSALNLARSNRHLWVVEFPDMP